MNQPQEFRHLLVIEDRKGRRIVFLEEGNYTIGRDSHNPIILYDYQVSRTHATLIRRIEEDENGAVHYCYRIIDGDLQGKRSTNGLFINGRAVISHDLKHGDVIRFGGEAKAHYYIIPANAGIDLFNPESLDKISASRVTLNSQSSETVINKEEQNKEDQQELIRLASFPELSPNPIIEIDWEGNITYVNPAASLKFETLFEEKLKHPILAGLLEDFNSRQGNLFLREVKIGNEVFEQYVHYLSEKKLIRSYIYDFTQRKQAEAQLRESQALYRAIVRMTSEGIFLAYAGSRRLAEANPAFLNLLGYSHEEITNLTLYNLIATELTTLNQDLSKILETKQDLQTKYLYRRKDGTFVSLDTSISLIAYQNKEMFCFVIKDSSKVVPEDEYSNYYALHDPLLHIANQKLFEEQLQIAVAQASRYQQMMGMVVAEILHWEEYCQHHPQLKDNTLKNLTEIIKSCLRQGDLLARWDNNKFMALLPRLRGPKEAAVVVKKISTTVEEYLQKEAAQDTVKLALNLSLLIYPIDGNTPSLLIKNALLSLEQAKNNVPANLGVSGFYLSPKSASLLKLEGLIGTAIKEQQFFLCYQPQINCNTKELTGLETLLRWEHPELGKVTPRHFLRLTEETDFMLPLGVWILQTATLQMQKWREENIPPVPLGVNISARQFFQPNFPEIVLKILEQTGLPPQFLELEVTENCLLQDTELAYKILHQLAKGGIRLCYDGFGVGNSSLVYLQTVPFNTVKISPSVISQIETSPQSQALVESMAILSKGYKFRLVAVGVEKLEQVELLRKLGCYQIQGNLITRPLPTKEATVFLQKAEYPVSL